MISVIYLPFNKFYGLPNLLFFYWLNLILLAEHIHQTWTVSNVLIITKRMSKVELPPTGDYGKA